MSSTTSPLPNMAGNSEPAKKKVLVVGAGAAGMSCAYHLSQHPEKFDITVIEASDYCGGQAFSIPIDKSRYGASWLNQGVQGGSYAFHHTMTMFARQGHAASPVKLQVSFGKGDHFWTNVYPTKLLQKHAKEAKRFQTMLKVVRLFELVFALLPIKYLVKLFWFSYEFAYSVALPMVALFLGTGNYTPDVPSIILERLCTSPTIGMWYPCEGNTVFSELPEMVVFPEFGRFYQDWQADLEKRGVNVRLSTEVTEVVSRDKNGVGVKTIKRTPKPDAHNPTSARAAEDSLMNADRGAGEEVEHYDEIVLCCLADTAKRLLGETASFREKKVLGSAKFSDDITITHNDSNYMRNHYENFFNAEQAIDEKDAGDHETARLEMGRNEFRPMYYIKQYPEDMTKLEMCFDCTNYQAQFPPQVEFDKHIFQTIYLNKQRDDRLWTDNEIDESKVIRKDWWHQLCHSWTHYVFVVPWLWLLQGRRHTRFASSWTVVNAHEVAIISGLAAAVDLGASYPEDLERDSFALLSFRLYYLLVYGRWYKRRTSTTGPGEDWGSGVYKSVYRGPGVIKRDRWMHEREAEAE
ncbi:flavin-containing amine oxidasedehydrogenase [Rhypophila sp. PSN 637]